MDTARKTTASSRLRSSLPYFSAEPACRHCYGSEEEEENQGGNDDTRHWRNIKCALIRVFTVAMQKYRGEKSCTETRATRSNFLAEIHILRTRYWRHYLRHGYQHNVPVVLECIGGILHCIAVFRDGAQHDVLVVTDRGRRVFEAFRVQVDLI